MKKIKVLSVVLLAFLLVFMLGGCDFSSEQLGENEVKVLNSEFTFEGTNYEDVVEILQDWGFTNIETEPVYDIVWGFTQEGSTKSVSIDGSNTYKYGDIFDKDVLVVVTYSMKVSDDPANKEYEITWKNADGTTLRTDQVLVGTVPVYNGNEPTKAALNEVKYVFNGWTPEITEVEGDQTYTATFIEVENLFTITFDLDGGQWDLDNSQSVIYNGQITSTIPTKDGFDFDGWVTKGIIFSTPFDITTNIKQDYALTATWTTAKHIVTYDLDGGTWSRSDEQTVNNNGLITITEPVKDGHDFVGWMLNDELFDRTTPVTEDLSLTAQWYLPNYEDILVGRWECRGEDCDYDYSFSFIEFDGYFYDLDNERRSSLLDYNHDSAFFTLYGNKIGFIFGDGETVYFTISYSDDRIVMENEGYADIILYKTEEAPNSLGWKWYSLYQFAKTQSDIKIDEFGAYYEIVMQLQQRNISPTSKLMESNRQVIKVYSNKLIDIAFYYVGVNDPEIEMIVNLAFVYDHISNQSINNAYISIETENYLMIASEGNTSIEFDQDVDLFWFLTENLQINANSFPVANNEAIYTLEYFIDMVLFDVAEYLLIEQSIDFFTR